MSLTNLMVDREMLPEFLYVYNVQKHAAMMHSVIDRWLRFPLEMQSLARELDELRQSIVQTGGVTKAADTILQLLGQETGERAAA